MRTGGKTLKNFQTAFSEADRDRRSRLKGAEVLSKAAGRHSINNANKQGIRAPAEGKPVTEERLALIMGQAFGAYAEEAKAAIDERINAAMEGTFKSTGIQAQDSGSEVLLQKIAALTKELAALKAAGSGTGGNGTGENYRPTKPGPKCKYCNRWHPKVAQKD